MSDLLIINNSQGSFHKHSSAVIDPDAVIGHGTVIWHFSHIMSHALIGSSCIVGQNVFVGSQAVIGDRVKIQNNVSIYDRVIIEEDVFLGPSMVFTNVINPRAFIQRKNEYRETRIRKGATVGANATILCGVTVGQFAMIGAGAVVTKDVLDYAVMVGVPARQNGWVCWCGTTLNKDLKCPDCSRQYQTENNQLREWIKDGS